MNVVLTPDVCVVGAGSAGLVVASGAAQLGLDVVLIERAEMGLELDYEGHRLSFGHGQGGTVPIGACWQRRRPALG